MSYCQNCGLEAPTKYVEFYQNIGMLIMRQTKSIKGDLCKKCINECFWPFTGITLVLGWWGLISFILTPIILLNNVIRYIGTLGLEAPTDSLPRSQAEKHYEAHSESKEEQKKTVDTGLGKKVGYGIGSAFTIFIILKLIVTLSRVSEYQSFKEQFGLVSSPPAPTNTPIYQSTPTPRPTNTPEAAPVNSRSESANLIDTFDPPTVVKLGTQTSVAEVTALKDLNVRSGPGTDYPAVGALRDGETARIVGRNADGSWWQIVYGSSKAWVSANKEYSSAVNTSGVPVVDAPPPSLSTSQPASTRSPSAKSTEATDSAIYLAIADKIIKTIPYYATGKYTAEDLICPDWPCPGLFPDLIPLKGNVTLWVLNLWREEMTLIFDGIEYKIKPPNNIIGHPEGLILEGQPGRYEYRLVRPGQEDMAGRCDLTTPDAIYAAYLEAGGWYSCFQLWP